MTKYNWKEVPEYINWIARDKNGNVWGYQTEPRIVPDVAVWSVRGDAECDILGCFTSRGILDDWTESLEERPKPEPRYKMGYARWDATTLRDDIDGRYLTMGEILDLLNEREQ
jgi:hypothetical protein